MTRAARIAVRILLWLGAGVALVLALVFYLLHAPAPREPALSARPVAETVKVGTLDRKYLVYAPARRPAGPAPLLVAFHGSMGTADRMRAATGYEFDRLADRHGFVVAYPQGHEGNWNDCRKAAGYAARRLNIDDAGFFAALVARLHREQNIDPSRVFVVGLSGGGAYVMRLALEHPDRIAGAAIFAASLPTRENFVCTPSGRPLPIMLVNGTRDPINPYEGGDVTLFGLANRGPAQSARESARYFAGLGGASGPVITRHRPEGRGDRTWVERSVWRTAGGGEVALLSVNGGGHVVPQPVYRSPRLLGRVTAAINGPEEAWSFFRRQRPSPAPAAAEVAGRNRPSGPHQIQAKESPR